MLLILAVSIFGCKKDDDGNRTTVYPVAGLLSLTGNWSSLGLTSEAAMKLATEDINTYFRSKGSGIRISFVPYDTKLDTTLSKNFFSTARDLGFRFVVGPQSSAELASVKRLADFTDMLVISQGSTAGSLALDGDGIFRFCPPDKIEGAAMAKTISEDGIKGLLTFARDDAGNKGLQSVVSSATQTLGIQVADTDPYSTVITDYAGLLAAAKPNLEALIAAHGAEKTAVYIACFDECVPLFKQASTDPVWSSVRWYGGDGVVLSAALTSDNLAAEFAVATQFFAPTFGLPEDARAKWEPLAARVKARSGIDPDAFGLAAYDAMWVIAKMLETNGGIPVDINDLIESFSTTANAYSGVTGQTTLDENGDRNGGVFDYYGIVFEEGQYKWKLVGKSE